MPLELHYPVPLWLTLLAMLICTVVGLLIGRAGRNSLALEPRASLGTAEDADGAGVGESPIGVSTESIEPALATTQAAPQTVLPASPGVPGETPVPLVAAPVGAADPKHRVALEPTPLLSGAEDLNADGPPQQTAASAQTDASARVHAQFRRLAQENQRLREETQRHRKALGEAAERVRLVAGREQAATRRLQAILQQEQQQSREKARLIRTGQDHIDARVRLARQFDVHMRHRNALLSALEATLDRMRQVQKLSDMKNAELRRRLHESRREDSASTTD